MRPLILSLTLAGIGSDTTARAAVPNLMDVGATRRACMAFVDGYIRPVDADACYIGLSGAIFRSVAILIAAGGRSLLAGVPPSSCARVPGSVDLLGS